MDELIAPLEALVDEFRALPGVGKKTAVKYAFRVLEMTQDEAQRFASTLLEAKVRIKKCRVCCNISEDDVCPVCLDERRDRTTVCVVENACDVMALEKSHTYKGLYHVLEGTISPVDRRGPDDIRISELLARVAEGGINEVIIATNATVDGETTAMYLQKQLKAYSVRVSRLAYGLPVGADIEYADEVTISRALEGRREY